MDIIDLYRQVDAERVRDFVRLGQEEHLQLEFKTLNGSGLENRDDRKNFAKALSGFANSAGGILAWGIEASKNAEGVDAASGFRLIDNLPLLVSRLNELTGASASPLVERIEHRSIEIDQGHGVVLTVIPESSIGPHMAKGGENRYYKRSGDSFYPMEHFDIADMFGRRRRPELSIVATIHRDSVIRHAGGTVDYRGRAVVAIRNNGRGVASAPYLALKIESPYARDGTGINGNQQEGLPLLPQSRSDHTPIYAGSPLHVIHPGTVFNVGAVRVSFDQSGKTPIDLDIGFVVTAEGISSASGRVSVPGFAIQQALVDDNELIFDFAATLAV